jgi:hypothetical protein
MLLQTSCIYMYSELRPRKLEGGGGVGIASYIKIEEKTKMKVGRYWSESTFNKRLPWQHLLDG